MGNSDEEDNNGEDALTGVDAVNELRRLRMV